MVVKLIAIVLLKITLSVITGHAVLENNSISNHESLEVSTSVDDNLPSGGAVIKSIQSEDGDIIDCVDIYKQPAFNHPALRNHKIQMKPSYVPRIDITSRKIKKTKHKNKQPKADIPISVTTQLWQKSGSCPEGTVPIRRMQTKAKKPDRFFHHSKHGFNQSKAVKLLRKNHSMSIMITEGYAYLGAKGDIAIFYPPVELDNEYSASHVALENGPRDEFEAVKSGWAVNPRVYGDRQTRFFVYWTADGSHKTGCFDHVCPGFVQVRNDIALGAAIHPVPTTNGLPSAVMIIYIFKDRATNNWWVNFGENRNIGYWPGKLFKFLSHFADSVQWGGDVYSSRVGGTHPHTTTGMGSGSYALIDGRISGEIRRIRVLENSMVLKYPEWATTFSDEYECYDYILYRDVEDPEFYYGGPGGDDPRCP